MEALYFCPVVSFTSRTELLMLAFFLISPLSSIQKTKRLRPNKKMKEICGSSRQKNIARSNPLF